MLVRVLLAATTMVKDQHVALRKGEEVDLPINLARSLVKAGTAEVVAQPKKRAAAASKKKVAAAPEDKKVPAAPENKAG